MKESVMVGTHHIERDESGQFYLGGNPVSLYRISTVTGLGCMMMHYRVKNGRSLEEVLTKPWGLNRLGQ